MEQKMYAPKYKVEPGNVMEELANYMLADGYDFVLDMEKSFGPTLIEARTGKKYLDFFTCFASMPIGFNHPKVKEESFINYLSTAALNKPSNSDIYTEVMATFVKTFFKIAVPSYFKYSFFISGGALAVENALKAAFDWKVKKNQAKGIEGEKGSKIIHFKEAFHGRSGYTMSLTNTDPNKVALFPKFDWPRVTNPKLIFPLTEENLAQTIKDEKKAVKEIKKAFKDNKDDIAAIIIEPIQGEGGDNHFRPEFMLELRNLCDKNEALLIFDEVQSGVGLTGKMWAHEHYGVIPDIMAFGKKMQVCGILAGEKLDEVENNVFRVSSRINSTWGGNLVDMARATRYLEIIEEENLIDNAEQMGDKLLVKLQSLAERYPDYIDAARGKGLFCSFDMATPEIRAEFQKKCFEKGLFILSCGTHTMRFRPPLNINERQMDEGFAIVEEVMKEIAE